MSPQRAPLSNARWHFQHGPIDLVIGAEGDPVAVETAHAAAWRRFETVLAELVGELPLLRAPVASDRATTARCPLAGPIARRMWHACAPFAAGYITPMAAVAGAVADEIARAYARPGIERAWVDNGGDIALVLAPGRLATIGLVTDPRPPLNVVTAATRRNPPVDIAAEAAPAADPGQMPIALDGRLVVGADRPVRGVATSGWRGRSFSRGIADSVTVLARTAAEADAAATVIANAVDVPGDPRIGRAPANALKDDTDLGAIAVTVEVRPLDPPTLDAALDAGAAVARALQRAGRIDSAVLVCQHRTRLVAPLALGASGERRAGISADGTPRFGTTSGDRAEGSVAPGPADRPAATAVGSVFA